MATAPFLEFGICGIDRSIPPEVLPEVFKPVEGVRFVAAFQLAYQGFPWAPTPAYTPGAVLSGRRYEGLVYPSWDEVDKFRRALPEGTPLSFHLNETPPCPYVSGLLCTSKDKEYHNDVLRLVNTLVVEYNARHVQVNLTAEGVPTELFIPEGRGGAAEAMGEEAAAVLVDLCRKYTQTVFLVPIAQLKRKDGTDIDTLPFFKRLISKAPPPNLSAFFDSSAGTGKEPDKAPELPDGYAKANLERVGFTGGIHADNAQEWLQRYAARAKENHMSLISDAQSGFRKDRKRGAEVDVEALKKLAEAVRKWGHQWAPAGDGRLRQSLRGLLTNAALSGRLERTLDAKGREATRVTADQLAVVNRSKTLRLRGIPFSAKPWDICLHFAPYMVAMQLPPAAAGLVGEAAAAASGVPEHRGEGIVYFESVDHATSALKENRGKRFRSTPVQLEPCELTEQVLQNKGWVCLFDIIGCGPTATDIEKKNYLTPEDMRCARAAGILPKNPLYETSRCF